MYRVKTRNWNCSRTVKSYLDLTLKLGVYRGDNYEDGDGKYCFETKNALQAWGIWLYFMALRCFSGGWTYIVRPGKQLKAGCKAIY